MEDYCQDCDSPYCFEIVPCPECRGTGIFVGAGISGVNEPNFYGLQHPLNLLESCRVCEGKKEIIMYCEHYEEG